jgi:hypothetical protein
MKTVPEFTPGTAGVHPAETLLAPFSTELELLQEYCQWTNRVDDYEHPKRVFTLLHDFCGSDLNDGVYSAALLVDVAQRVNDPVSNKNALSFLKAYSLERPSDWEFVSCITADLAEVENRVVAMRQGSYDNESDQLLKKILTPVDETCLPREIPVRLWNIPSNRADDNDIWALLDDVNLESVLIKAVDLVDNISHNIGSESALLRDVFDAETFYAPLCEYMGYDGLAMYLRSEAALSRLRHAGGNTEIISEAQTELMKFTGPRGRNVRTSGILNELYRSMLASGSFLIEQSVTDRAEHGIQFGVSTIVEPFEGVMELRAVWRIKSLGSLALKLNKCGRLPADVLGITLIADEDVKQPVRSSFPPNEEGLPVIDDSEETYERDAQTVATVFSGLIAALERMSASENPRFVPMPAPSRDKAYHIRGSEKFIGAVLGHSSLREVLGEELTDLIDIPPPKEEGYQVAKVTFLFDPEGTEPALESPIPVEIQVQTRRDRFNSRTGSCAHVAHKAGKAEQEPQANLSLVRRRIKARRDTLGYRIPLETSEPRGQKLRNQVKRFRAMPLRPGSKQEAQALTRRKPQAVR